MEDKISKKSVKAINLETFIFIIIMLVGFIYISNIMGIGIMFKVIMNTAHDLLSLIHI